MSAHESNFHLDPQQRVAQLRLELTAAQARQASLEQENDHLRTSVKEALEQQTVTSEILRVIASSPTDLQPVLDAVAENAARVCGADDAIIHRIDGEVLRAVAHHGPVPMFPPIGSPEGLAIRGSITGRAVLERRAIHIHDVAALSEAEFPVARRNQQLTGQRTTLAAPLLGEGVPIGTILIRRLDVRPFTDKQIEMLKTFADQAVIAIENTRLFKELEARNRELTEALRHQTATAEILRVINRSPTEAQPVFDAIVEGALQLCDGLVSAVYRLDRDRIHLVAHRNLSAEGLQEFRRAYPLPLSAESLVAQTILDRTAVHVSDAQEDPGVPALARRIAPASGYRSVLLVPMLREGTAIGAIGVTRREAGQFSKKQVQLLRTFADQAVIAMENVRLFNELEARNKELTEALEQQTAIAGVLGVISSSPTDLRPVYQAILSNVRQLCEASFAALFLYDGEVLTTAAHQNASPALAEHLRQFRHPPGRQTATRRAALERRPVHIADVLADPEYTPLPAFLREGLETVLSVPMLRERTLVGVITTWRREIKPFTDKQITLLKTFADQAVIAIEGARLFRQLQARNRDLAEALEHQTATNEVLSVMSRSTFDLEPLLETIIENGTRLCGAERGFVYQFDGEVFRLVAAHGASTEFRAFLLQNPVRSGRGSVAGRTALERRTVHIHDVLADAEYDQPDLQQRGGYRTVLGVPMLREGALIGVITWVKSRVEPFSDKQIELVTGFADQAAIAIEHVRLFQDVTEEHLEAVRTAPIRLGEGAIGWAGATRATVQVADILDEREPVARQSRHILARLGYRSLLAIPLLREDRLLGGLVVWREERGDFPSGVVSLLETFAAQSVIAIENARLFGEVGPAPEGKETRATCARRNGARASD
jgi:GAF domain-containing protein